MEWESVVGCNVNVCRENQYGAWLVIFREDIAEEVTSETVKAKKELIDQEKAENIKTFIQRQSDMFEKLKMASVTGVRKQITQTTLIWLFGALHSGLYLQFSPGIGPAKVNSDLLAVKSNGCFPFFLLPGLFQMLTTAFIVKFQPRF